MTDKTPLLAVLIDADNVSAKETKAIFDEIAGIGEASVRRVYGDFSQSKTKGWSNVQAEFGLVPHHQPENTVGKNASDIALVIDAMDLMHSGRFDGFVLVSSDSDFTRLASRIREQGLDVTGIGKKTTPVAFRKACKRFLFLENLDGSGDEAATETRKAPAKQNLGEAKAQVLRAMDAMDQEGEWYNLGRLGQMIVAAQSDFDPRSYGRAKLSDLVRDLKIFETRRGVNNQVEVRRLD